MRSNPFTPGFGTLPPVLVGREHVLAALAPLLRRFNPKDRHWATHLRAHRGAGKTVLLDQVQDHAVEEGWWVIQEDGGSGPPLPQRVINRGLARLAELDPPPKRRISEVSAAGFGIATESTDQRPMVSSVRDVLQELAAAETNGVLITIDEVHQAPDQALNEIGNAAQHVHRAGLPLLLVMAGLPRPSSRREPTFLARAWRPALGRLSEAEVEEGLVATAASADGSFDAIGLRRAIEITAGQPYLMQLVGFHAWDVARRSPITSADVLEGSGSALTDYRQAVTAQLVAATTGDARRFLIEMARVGSPARMGQIREATGWSSQQAGVYRSRLLDSGLIESEGYGLVSFAVPGVVDELAEEL